MLKYLLPALLALSFTTASAQLINKYERNKDYHPLVTTIDEGQSPKVIEFFWFGCPHCYTTEPTLNKWLKEGKSSKVAFEKIPAIPSERWEPSAQLYYTLEALDRLDLTGVIFDAIHRDNNTRLVFVKDKMREFLGTQGVKPEDFDKAWDSFGVKQRLQRAKKMFEDSKLDGVPVFVVNGQFSVPVELNLDPMFRKINTLAETVGVSTSPAETSTVAPKTEAKAEEVKAEEAKAEDSKTEAKEAAKAEEPKPAAKEEAKAEEAKPETKEEAKADAKPEAASAEGAKTEEAKPEAAPAEGAKAEAKPEATQTP